MVKIFAWLKYYRASLIDGNRGEKDVILPDSLIRQQSFLNRINENELQNIWDKQKIFKFNFDAENKSFISKDDPYKVHEDYHNIDIENLANGESEDELTEINKIEIAPVFITSAVEHGEKTGDTKLHFPFWIPAYLDEKGKLYPPKEGEIPVFVRNYLDPNPRDLPSMTKMEILDTQLINRYFNKKKWSMYWADCEKFFQDCTGKKFKDFHVNERYHFSICKPEESNTTRNILALYNELIFEKNASKKRYSLLENILEEKEEPQNIELDEVKIFLNPNHFGQMNGDFPLSYSQRIAFAQFSSDYNKKSFAINGPPGTGKTTILQSVIANLTAQSVLNKEDSPLLIGCSANNQAITNILDSMHLKETQDILAQRWLPDVKSFGLYLAASSKKETAKKYQIETSSFLNNGFVKSLDDKAKIYDYQTYFTKKFIDYFAIDEYNSTTNTSDFFLNYIEIINKKILSLKRKIETFQKVALRKFEVKSMLCKNGYENFKSLLNKIDTTEKEIQKTKTKQESLNNIRTKLFERKKEFPFYVEWFPFKSFKLSRANAYQLIVQPVLDLFPKEFKWYNFYFVIARIEKFLFDNANLQIELAQTLTDLIAFKKDIEQRNITYQVAIENWLLNYRKKWKNLTKNTGYEYQDLEVLEDTAVKLDISYRHELFWLCVHHREWQYIQELMEIDTENSERGENSYKSKLRRIAKVTPLFISTFHTLPKFSNYYKYSEGNKFYKALFDLMIVDESGQVSPEVAIPSLTFAKKILAVGDVYQIEPIWRVTNGVDYVNAKKYNLIRDEKDFEKLNSFGFTASNGNLMKMVKKSTPFSFKHAIGEFEKGAYLLEHRRCLDPIIAFSKENVYKGSLNLMIGNKHNKNHHLPPLGYIHVDGSSEKHNDSSRKNIKEAKSIVQWVLNNQENLENAYAKSLDKILAIITPFSAQKIILKKLFTTYLDRSISNKIIIGTVHALQGAERAIVLFSAVHDTQDKTLFFDYQGKFNMLNVALTRARHSFVVFGNMTVFNPYKNSPSGKLAQLLFSDKNYSLDDKFLYQSEIIYASKSVSRIDTLEKHRQTLAKCFEVAEKELIIFSPFISIKALETDNVIQKINKTTNKGIKITILTDKFLDSINGKLKSHSELGRKAIEATKANLIIVNGIHNKTICVDNRIIIEGSFNWLSATRDSDSPYFRNEISVVIQGEKVKEDIEKIKTNFEI